MLTQRTCRQNGIPSLKIQKLFWKLPTDTQLFPAWTMEFLWFYETSKIETYCKNLLFYSRLTTGPRFSVGGRIFISLGSELLWSYPTPIFGIKKFEIRPRGAFWIFSLPYSTGSRFQDRSTKFSIDRLSTLGKVYSTIFGWARKSALIVLVKILLIYSNIRIFYIFLKCRQPEINGNKKYSYKNVDRLHPLKKM